MSDPGPETPMDYPEADPPGRGDAAGPVPPGSSPEDATDASSSGPLHTGHPQPSTRHPEAPSTSPADSSDVVDDLVREKDEYLDSLRRLQAEFENYRKRVAKQQSEQTQRASAAFIDKLLPVLDTLDLALAHDPSGSLAQVSAALWDVLTREKLERIDQAGMPFDPHVHDAVAHEPGDEAPAMVIEVMRAGYAHDGKVLRPAMVRVKGS